MEKLLYPFDSTSRPVKPNIKTARYAHESVLLFFSLERVSTGIPHSCGLQMGFKMYPMFIQGNSLGIVHSDLLPERDHSLPLRSVGLPRPEVGAKVNS